MKANVMTKMIIDMIRADGDVTVFFVLRFTVNELM